MKVVLELIKNKLALLFNFKRKADKAPEPSPNLKLFGDNPFCYHIEAPLRPDGDAEKESVQKNDLALESVFQNSASFHDTQNNCLPASNQEGT